MSVKVPEYVLIDKCTFVMSSTETITLPQGSYVKPIELKYVPKHVVEDERWKYFRERDHMFCYTRYGTVMIDRRNLRVR